MGYQNGNNGRRALTCFHSVPVNLAEEAMSFNASDIIFTGAQTDIRILSQQLIIQLVTYLYTGASVKTLTNLIAQIFGFRGNIIRNLQFLFENGIHGLFPIASIERSLHGIC
jgi:hypothetical protein